jgi:hypothetical protein
MILNVLSLMENTRDIGQTTPDLLALPGPAGGSPHVILIVLTLLLAVGFWLHKTRR